MAAGDVQVGDHELRVGVGGGCRRGGAGSLQVDALDAVEQSHLAETGAGVRVARVLGEGLLVRGDRARVVALFDGGEGLGVERRQRLLRGLLGTGVSAVDGNRSGDAVLRRELQQLGEDFAHLLLGHGTGEQRHRLPRDERDDHRNRLGPEALGELRVRVDIDLGEHDLAGELDDDLLEDGAQLLAGTAPLCPQVDDDGHAAREFEDLTERRIGDIEHEGRRGGASRSGRSGTLRGRGGRLRTVAQRREVDGAAQNGTGGRSAHGDTFASRRLER
ncbi:hypothetical protein RKD05_002886 [Microbacterium sp. SLBN-111]